MIICECGKNIPTIGSWYHYHKSCEYYYGCISDMLTFFEIRLNKNKTLILSNNELNLVKDGCLKPSEKICILPNNLNLPISIDNLDLIISLAKKIKSNMEFL